MERNSLLNIIAIAFVFILWLASTYAYVNLRLPVDPVVEMVTSLFYGVSSVVVGMVFAYLLGRIRRLK